MRTGMDRSERRGFRGFARRRRRRVRADLLLARLDGALGWLDGSPHDDASVIRMCMPDPEWDAAGANLMQRVYRRVCDGSPVGAALAVERDLVAAARRASLVGSIAGRLVHIATCVSPEELASWCLSPDRRVRAEATANPACPPEGRVAAALLD